MNPIKKVIGLLAIPIMWAQSIIHHWRNPLPECPRCGEEMDARGHEPEQCWRRCETCSCLFYGELSQKFLCEHSQQETLPSHYCVHWQKKTVDIDGDPLGPKGIDGDE